MEVSPYGKRKFIYSVDCNHLTKVNISEIERERERENPRDNPGKERKDQGRALTNSGQQVSVPLNKSSAFLL